MPSVRVHTSPKNISPIDLRNGLAIVIDLLRASTTIVHALAAGAAAIAPCESIETARERAARLPPGSYLLGGERKGLRIEGFDLGNSPTEYTAAKIKHKTIIFTTTNGTVALHRAQSASRILIGCFANLSAITKAAQDSDLPIHLICAGIHAEPCREDTLCAGAIASLLVEHGLGTSDDGTTAAINAWNTLPDTLESRIAALRGSEGGLNLISAGLEADIPTSAQIDSHPIIPEWDQSRQLLLTNAKA